MNTPTGNSKRHVLYFPVLLRADWSDPADIWSEDPSDVADDV